MMGIMNELWTLSSKQWAPDGNEDRDEDGTNRICDHPSKGVDEYGRDYHSNTAQRVSQNMQEDT